MPDMPKMSVPPVQGLPIDKDEPVFHAPWQAKTFALTVKLHEAGLFTWPAWAEVFSDVLKSMPADMGGDIRSADYAEAYFTAWTTALERMIASAGVADAARLGDVAATWQRAAEATPHGTPILYERGLELKDP